MATTVMQATDVTAASYAAALFAMAGTAVLLLLVTGWVGSRWKLVVALCAVAALVGTAEISRPAARGSPAVRSRCTGRARSR